MPKSILPAYTAAALRARAKQRLPRLAFDFVDGGAGQELALHRNTAAFEELTLTPRIGNDPSQLSLQTELLGMQFAAPFGIAPMGLCGLIHPRADLCFAKAAAQCNLPYILSATASTSIEEITSACGSAPWFQLYTPKSAVHTEQLLTRVERAGAPVLIITLDTAAPGLRLRDLRNGLRVPFTPSASNLLDIARHPAWLVRRLMAGQLHFPNLPQPEDDMRNCTFQELVEWQTGGILDWATLQRIRAMWPRKILLKGVLCASDAMRAAAMGFDGVIVSNHGGRQLDAAPAPLKALSQFVAQGMGPQFLSMDSGIRSGEDIVKSLACGAGFGFVGRPFLYAIAAHGEAGVSQLIEVLIGEIRRSMKLLGVNSPHQLGKLFA